ncbi:histidine phosphatase family protein [Paenibacillus hemerocallicola]|uniref:Histidine phosphatase family protein n=1 Tax=Paenibacillus hemerocallicola TaxID=1172614 RepID=A0A5C4SYS5_9BACL|nr:histidine phosphatase family protein [Paenibacillus hemerocallicola]
MAQAIQVGRQMKLWGIDVMYSSCMQRTLETAGAIYESTNVSWHVWPSLIETDRRGWPSIRERISSGQSVGSSAVDRQRLDHPNHLPLEALRQRFGSFTIDPPSPWQEQWWLQLANETREQAYARADETLHHLLQRHRGSNARIAVVCHNAFGSVLLSRLTLTPPCDHVVFGHAHAAISAVDVFETHNQIRFTNYVGHLSHDEVTEGVDFGPLR